MQNLTHIHMSIVSFSVIFGSLFSGNDIQFQSLITTWLIIMISAVVICFTISEITRNYSQVDKLWSLLPIAYSWVTVSASPSPRVFLMASLVTLWGLRLSYNFSRKGGYNIIPWKGEEDYRWKVMRENPILRGRLRFGLFNLLFISLYQNILIFLFSLPLLLASIYPDKPLTVIDIMAAIMMTFFIIAESIADNQLFKFYREKKMKGDGKKLYEESLRKGFMTEGLWGYSRHPNFASEQAIWICFYFFGVAASGQWLNLTVTGPVLLVLLFIGSSQLTESISSKKYPGYELYQKEVPKFIPKIRNRSMIKNKA
jgi:steroid 5-alpha reductase family enzyme